jgi:hypothetical protein
MTRFLMIGLSAATLATVACAGGTGSAKAGTPRPAAAERDAKPTGKTSAANGATREVVGRVELLNRANEVTLSGTERVGLAFDKFKIDPRTEVTVNGERASAADVNPGDEVRASFSGHGEDAHLQKLEVLPPGK